jgi:hypothetical protein
MEHVALMKDLEAVSVINSVFMLANVVVVIGTASLSGDSGMLAGAFNLFSAMLQIGIVTLSLLYACKSYALQCVLYDVKLPKFLPTLVCRAWTRVPDLDRSANNSCAVFMLLAARTFRTRPKCTGP